MGALLLLLLLLLRRGDARVARMATGGRPLRDLRVVEYGRYVSAPFCSRLLADAGADVVKVEDPSGDPTRSWGPDVFAYLNAGKRVAVADLDDPAGAEWLDAQLDGSDVLVENVESWERDLWRLDFDSLLERHPHLVVVSLSPYGRSGEWASRPGTDLTASALSSLALGLGERDREPLRLPFDQGDYQAGLHAAAAALCAVRERRTSGEGQGVDVATAQVLAYCVGGMHLVIAKVGLPWQRKGRLQQGIYPTGFFECRDGFVCIASQSPKQWTRLRDLMGAPDWAPEKVRHPTPELDESFRAWLSERTRGELTELAKEHDITLGAVNNVDELLTDPHLEQRGLWTEVLPGSRVPGPGYLMAATPARPGRAPVAETPAPPPPVRRVGSGERLAPLHGVRVLEFGFNWAGPMAGQLLADMGAEVIRVETEKRQDLMRLLPFTSFFFCHNNRSKLSVTVNVTRPEGTELVRDLAARSDIVIDNFSAGIMKRNGLGYEALKEANPRIICVSMSMAGQQGPLRGMRGFASIATGFAGLEQMVGYEDGHATGLMAFGLGDTNLAVQGALSALIALHHRERAGEGQFVDVSQIDCSISTLGEPLLRYQATGEVAGPQGNTHPSFFPHGVFRCAGVQRWLAVAVRDEREWHGLCRTLERPEWANDPALASGSGRRARREEIDAALAAWCEGIDRDDAASRLCEAGVPAAPLLELPERDAHPHFTSRGLVLDHDAPGFDPCHVYATPWLLTATPPAMTRPAPGLGEHNAYVFGDLLGLSKEAIARMAEDGVIA